MYLTKPKHKKNNLIFIMDLYIMETYNKHLTDIIIQGFIYIFLVKGN